MSIQITKTNLKNCQQQHKKKNTAEKLYNNAPTNNVIHNGDGFVFILYIYTCICEIVSQL